MKLRVAMIVTAIVLGGEWAGSAQLIRQPEPEGVSRAFHANSGPGDAVALASALPDWASQADRAGRAAPFAANGALMRHDIPEPTTFIAGALLLLPFVASALRILRKRRKAA
jgi:hypothetical protein